MQVLLFSAQPDDVPQPLTTEFDIQAVRAALMPALKLRTARLCVVLDGRLSTLRTRVQQQPWSLIIISVHGDNPGQPHLWLESKSGQAESVNRDQLTEALQGSRAECLLLCSCESAPILAAHLQTTLFIPTVIGMQGKLLERAASVFLYAFCRALLQGATAGMAMQHGRQAMRTPLRAGEVWQGVQPPDLCLQVRLPQLFGNAEQCLFTAMPCSPSPPINSIPLFIGQHRRLHRWSQQLLRKKKQGLLICGAAGTGKTAIAIELALILRVQWKSVLLLDNLDSPAQLPPLATFGHYPYIIAATRSHFPVPAHYQRLLTMPLTITDFQRCAQAWGLVLTEQKMVRLYDVCQGYCAPLRLLLSLPPAQNESDFQRQLYSLHRWQSAQTTN